ncbi:hypothetical protein SAMN04515617_1293 [Collimonas sp. OK242]|jgi:hypothetical protein|uniref:hypothetical protein n=1 Tax=Collimonas sp. OK242 TaxID=1798195 RepID=UPI00089468BB|nr:hypothetical protein [Collimonas sp. OK242]SDY90374.1 hypothetical protein SAMN04515617_1293 [Collimonas sp. OK242]
MTQFRRAHMSHQGSVLVLSGVDIEVVLRSEDDCVSFEYSLAEIDCKKMQAAGYRKIGRNVASFSNQLFCVETWCKSHVHVSP